MYTHVCKKKCYLTSFALNMVCRDVNLHHVYLLTKLRKRMVQDTHGICQTEKSIQNVHDATETQLWTILIYLCTHLYCSFYLFLSLSLRSLLSSSSTSSLLFFIATVVDAIVIVIFVVIALTCQSLDKYYMTLTTPKTMASKVVLYDRHKRINGHCDFWTQPAN